ncbi:MAG: two-component system histidine kinase PnpS [Anaerohalosphaeraceae bacterium]
MMYVAAPITHEGNVTAVLRTSVAMDQLQATQQSIFKEIVRYGIIIAVVLAALSLALSWKISYPLELLRRGAERFADGDLTHRLPVPKAQDIGELAVSMNEMAAQLDDRIRTVVAQKNEQQAILSSMTEGVIAVSLDGHILTINSAAAKTLQTTEKNAVGRTVEEVFRNSDLQEFVQQAAESDDPAEKQIILHENVQNERYLWAHGTALRDDQRDKIGVLIVLNDVTHIRQLEKVRRDFVANVSHELKTPVTSIKGFIETLLDGAIDKPEDGRRFLEIIARQTNRLNSIIDDLLALSRIEQQTDQEAFVQKPIPIKPILTAVAGLCEIAATEKKITIEIDCPETLQAPVNSSLLEQAVVNLVDNAIKYSDPDNNVLVKAVQEGQHVLIHIHDNGCGIDEKYLPRVFERFYRVDKARSRKLGGTGLGLAIVKHIAQYHQGTVTVESKLGKGSTFTLCLPSEA